MMMLFPTRLGLFIFLALLVALVCTSFLLESLAQVWPSYGQGASELISTPPAHINGFHFVSATEGWLWMGRLYWTKNNGGTWTDITPPNSNASLMSNVSFVD